MMEEQLYNEDRDRKRLEHEALCKRCGACCGVLDGDPCEHLKKEDDGRYSCDIYESRFGLRRTLRGEPVLCVPMRDMLHKTWWGSSQCAYVKLLKKRY